MIGEQLSRYVTLTLDRDTPVKDIPSMVEDAIANDLITFAEDHDDDEFRIVYAKLDETLLLEDRPI